MELATISEIKCLRYLELMKVVVVNNFLKTFYVNNQCDTDQFQVWGWRHKDAILSPVITEYFSR